MPSFSSACFKLFLNLKSLPESLFEDVFHCFAMLFTDSPCQYLNINKACSFLLRVNNHLLIIGVISSSSYSVSVCGTDNISSISLKRISMLENILLKSLNQDYLTTKTKEILYLIQQTDELKVGPLAKQLSMNESTLYRLFMNQIGQSPKSFLKTVRFRKALDSILHFEKEKLTHIAYQNNYTDQSHFIRDFKEITGQSPNQLRNKTSIQQEQLAWIYAQH